jgi:hypothetical protein
VTDRGVGEIVQAVYREILEGWRDYRRSHRDQSDLVVVLDVRPAERRLHTLMILPRKTYADGWKRKGYPSDDFEPVVRPAGEHQPPFPIGACIWVLVIARHGSGYCRLVDAWTLGKEAVA